MTRTEWAPRTRLPLIGGPLAGQTRPAKGMTYRRKDWQPGEYRRTTTCWQWTPPPLGIDTTTEVVNTMQLASHPTPAVLANHGRDVANRIREHGTQVIRRASVLAARGLPSNTVSNGAATSDPTSSTERAAGLSGDDGDPTPPDSEWLGIDAVLAQLHRDWWRVGVQLLAAYDRIQSQGSDDDPIPAGTGSCRRCEKFCRPDEHHPDNRIRSGYCPACHKRWVRLGKPDRSAFDRTSNEDAA